VKNHYFLLTGGIERWLYRVARKHAGSQVTGWSFSMRQLFEKSGSAARFSDFAIDIRRVVAANQLPEYELSIDRNGEGEEIVRFIRRAQLALDHPSREYPRAPMRRQNQGIYSPAWKLNGSPEDVSGD
jgi:plasmid replication initiation protein